jgi:conjugative transfer signal peptidase TraF
MGPAKVCPIGWTRRVAARLTVVLGRARYGPVGLGAGALALLLVPLSQQPAPRWLWNASPSMPPGLYIVAPGSSAVRGDIVVAWLPPAARGLADRRHYLPQNVPILKQVAAGPGDQICANGAEVTINGIAAARRLAHDHAGRSLPTWHGCRTLSADEVFVLATRRPDSFDGRYFGVLHRADVVGTARLLWGW